MKHERIYLSKEDDRVFIDTYITNLGENKDAMLVIPGGGYNDVCTLREGEPVALEFVAKGFNAFVLNYRVAREGDVFPKQLLDAASAMLYIRNHAEEFKINPERVFAVGFSAGGHLCGTLATMYDFPEVKEAFGDDYIKVRPTGVILGYPVVTMYGPTHVNSFEKLLGKPESDFTDEERKRYSLETNVTKDTSPMFVWHTAEDTLVPIQGSIKLGMALTENKVPYRMSVFPYGPHGVVLGNEITVTDIPEYIQPIAEPWTKQAAEWIKTLPSSKF